MKNGLLLTLKQLIKLGVINFKKKKRRNKSKSSKTKLIDAFEKEINSSVPFNPQTKRYADFVGSGANAPRGLWPPSAPPQMTPYTDNLRLRDSNDNFNTRLMEYKNDLVGQKLLLNDQQVRQRALENDVDAGREFIMRELKPITYRSGYVIDDPVDVSQTYGSLTFQPQTSQPTTPEPSSVIPPAPRSLTEDDFFTSDAEPVLQPPSTNEPLIQSDSDEEINTPPITIKTKRKTQPRTRPRMRRGVSFSDEEGQELTESSALYAKSMSEGAGAGGGGAGGTSINFPNEPVPKHNNYPFSPEKVPYTPKGKPSVGEVQQWKQWYLLLGLNDPSILKVNTRSSYMKPILAKSLDEYKKLRGEKDPNILKSKDPRVIYRAVKQRLSGLG